MLRRSAPIKSLSLAASNSCMETTRLLLRPAIRAASFTRFASSAPEKPGVPRASTAASTSLANGTLRMCTFKICSRPRTSGSPTTTWRSKRPGRSSAGSSTSGRFVAAITITASKPSKPSISTSSWFNVCSRSSWPPPKPTPRLRPTASISSMKMMQGAFFLAVAKRSRTREAPTPTNISTKSEPDMEKNGTLASPAMARASSVLPVPGGPTMSTPRGMRPPSFEYLEGSFKKSTSSLTSSLASSQPATSAKVVLIWFSPRSLALLLPKESGPPLPVPCICRMKKIHTPIKSSIGNQEISTVVSTLCCSGFVPETLTLWVNRLSSRLSSRSGITVTNFSPPRLMPVMTLLSKTTS